MSKPAIINPGCRPDSPFLEPTMVEAMERQRAKRIADAEREAETSTEAVLLAELQELRARVETLEREARKGKP